jgi:hypothetical protein
LCFTSLSGGGQFGLSCSQNRLGPTFELIYRRDITDGAMQDNVQYLSHNNIGRAKKPSIWSME